MAEAFLNELLRVENSVQPNSGERCIICFTECGTLCPETGIVEWEIRLPCKHRIGSRCIAKWLDPTDGANDCPLCRYIFFPAQPRPYLELGVIEDEGLDRSISIEADNMGDIGRPNSPDHDPTHWNQESPEIVPTVLNYDLIDGEIGAMEDMGVSWDILPRLGFGRPQHNVSGAQNGDEDAYEEGNSEDVMPEPSAHVHDLRRSARLQAIAPEPPAQAITPRRSARQQGIAQRAGVESHEEQIDGEEDGRSHANHHNAPDLQTVKDMCEAYCRRLTYSSRVTDISQHFAEKIYIACLLAGHSLPSIAAVSVFVTTHFTGFPRTPYSVSMTSGVDADIIKLLYGFICPAHVRAELFDEEMLALIDRGDLETVLSRLPEA